MKLLLRADTSKAQSFTLLKNFFTYVDDLEFHVFNKKTLNRAEFHQAVEKVTNLSISDKEAEYLFAMMDTDQDGVIDTRKELQIEMRTDDISWRQRFRKSFKM